MTTVKRKQILREGVTMKTFKIIISSLLLSYSYMTYSGEIQNAEPISKPVNNLVDELFGK